MMSSAVAHRSGSKSRKPTTSTIVLMASSPTDIFYTLAANSRAIKVYSRAGVRSGVWPHGKPERALGPTGPAGSGSARSAGDGAAVTVISPTIRQGSILPNGFRRLGVTPHRRIAPVKCEAFSISILQSWDTHYFAPANHNMLISAGRRNWELVCHHRLRPMPPPPNRLRPACISTRPSKTGRRLISRSICCGRAKTEFRWRCNAGGG